MFSKSFVEPYRKFLVKFFLRPLSGCKSISRFELFQICGHCFNFNSNLNSSFFGKYVFIINASESLTNFSDNLL